jgi:hypothetical protein
MKLYDEKNYILTIFVFYASNRTYRKGKTHFGIL